MRQPLATATPRARPQRMPIPHRKVAAGPPSGMRMGYVRPKVSNSPCSTVIIWAGGSRRMTGCTNAQDPNSAQAVKPTSKSTTNPSTSTSAILLELARPTPSGPSHDALQRWEDPSRCRNPTTGQPTVGRGVAHIVSPGFGQFSGPSQGHMPLDGLHSVAESAAARPGRPRPAARSTSPDSRPAFQENI